MPTDTPQPGTEALEGFLKSRGIKVTRQPRNETLVVLSDQPRTSPLPAPSSESEQKKEK